MNVCINLESTQEIPDALEDVDKAIIAIPHVLGCLSDTGITVSWLERATVIHTERRTPIPEKMIFAGGNA